MTVWVTQDLDVVADYEKPPRNIFADEFFIGEKKYVLLTPELFAKARVHFSQTKKFHELCDVLRDVGKDFYFQKLS